MKTGYNKMILQVRKMGRFLMYLKINFNSNTVVKISKHRLKDEQTGKR